MSLEKKRRHGYYNYPMPMNPHSEEFQPYYPNDYDDWPVQAREGSVKYSSWKQFSQKYPFNAKLLVHLFGERDAIECHRSMVVMSEVKAASLCSFFPAEKIKPMRIKSMGDC